MLDELRPWWVNKDLTKIVSRARLEIFYDPETGVCTTFVKDERGYHGDIEGLEHRHSFRLYIWESRIALREAMGNEDRLTAGLQPNYFKRLRTCDGINMEDVWFPVLGEIHFCADKWSLEIVAHEVQHAMMQWAAAMGMLPKLDGNHEMETEEQLCYPAGSAVQEVYKWVYGVCINKEAA